MLYNVCSCGRVMKPLKNGVAVVELADFGPCALWRADVWYCPTCGTNIITGFGRGAYAEHFQDQFRGLMDREKEGNNLYEARHTGLDLGPEKPLTTSKEENSGTGEGKRTGSTPRMHHHSGSQG